MKNEKFDVYQMVTDRIIAQMEKGIIPWRKTWQGGEPINYVSRKPYRGLNLLLLPFGGEWLTFNQCKDLKGKIKKGEKASPVIYWNFLSKKDENGNVVLNKNGEPEKVGFMRYYNVFHISQCENIESKLPAIIENTDIKPIEAAQNVVDDYVKRENVKMCLVEGSNQAHYTPQNDTIVMPVLQQFESSEEYYSTLFHELSHSTGHKSRLDRLSDKVAFGNGTYSKEELVAEISAATLMHIVGIELQETFENSVAYLQAWISKLKNDNRLIVSASSKAQKSTELIAGSLLMQSSETSEEDLCCE